MQLLAQVKEPQALQSGVFKDTVENQDALWRETSNVWFGDGSVEVAGGVKTTDEAPADIFSMAAAEVEEEARLYLGCSDGVYYWSESRGDFPMILDGTWLVGYNLIGGAPNGRRWDLLPWGSHLLVTDNAHRVRYWQGDPDVVAAPIFVSDEVATFTSCKILKSLANHIIAINTSNGENRVEWSSVSDPLDWLPTPENTAGGQTIRDMVGPINAAAKAGDAILLVGDSSAALMRWIGGNDVFSITLTIPGGIGALGKDSICSFNRFVYGVSRHGFWRSDGMEVQPIGTPTVDRWYREHSNQIALGRGYQFCFADPRRKTVNWIFLDEEDGNLVRGLSFYTENGAWGQLQLPLTAAIGDGIFPYPQAAVGPIFGEFSHGQQVVDEGPLESLLRSGFFAAGSVDTFKLWDMVEFDLQGLDGDPQIRIGFAETPDENEIEWGDYQSLDRQVWIGRESTFVCFEIATSEASDWYRIGGFSIYGEKGGYRR